MNKKSRRFLKRLSDRKLISHDECLKYFYGSSLNNNIIFSFEKKRNKGKGRIKNRNKKNKKRILEKIKKNVQCHR